MLNVTKNFISMPGILKLLTLAAMFFTAWVVSTIFQNNIFAAGRRMDLLDWWASGAGWFCLVIGFIMGGSAVLMLIRSRYGRPAYIFGYVGISAIDPFLTYVTNIETIFMVQGFLFNIGCAALMALYLYMNKSVREYFRKSDNSFGDGTAMGRLHMWPLIKPTAKRLVILVMLLLILSIFLYFLAKNSDAYDEGARFVAEDSRVAASIGKVQKTSLKFWDRYEFGSCRARFSIEAISEKGTFAVDVLMRCLARARWRVEEAAIRGREGAPAHIVVEARGSNSCGQC